MIAPKTGGPGSEPARGCRCPDLDLQAAAAVRHDPIGVVVVDLDANVFGVVRLAATVTDRTGRDRPKRTGMSAPLRKYRRDSAPRPPGDVVNSKAEPSGTGR